MHHVLYCVSMLRPRLEYNVSLSADNLYPSSTYQSSIFIPLSFAKFVIIFLWLVIDVLSQSFSSSLIVLNNLLFSIKLSPYIVDFLINIVALQL